MKSQLVTLVESYGVSLKKVGNVYQGLCPFHDDSTPSFTIFPDTETFYCFGCGVFGNVRRFLELMNPSFTDSLKYDIISLQSDLDRLDKRCYREYVLYTSAGIFRKMFQKYPVSVVFNIMKRFDERAITSDLDFDTAKQLLEEITHEHSCK